MQLNGLIAKLLSAEDLGSLRVSFTRLCAHFGEIKSSDVSVAGTPGAFCAFCAVRMERAEDSERLIRRLGLKPLGGIVYLPIVLSPGFERRSAVRAA
ncbi:MAG: hypothetical protein ACT4P4_03450 [Betaproteobacteria bacterium]